MAVEITNPYGATASPAGVANSGSTVTYSNINIGTAASDRITVIPVGTELASATINSATIDYGTGAVAMKLGEQGVLGAVYARILYLPTPTGTTANVVITFGAGPAATTNHIAVYRVVGASVNPQETGQWSDTDGDPISTADATTPPIRPLIPTGGGMIAICSDATDSTARTWTGLTEDIDADAGGFRFSTGISTTPGSGAYTVSGPNAEDAATSYIVFIPTAVNFGDLVGCSDSYNTSIPASFSPSRAITISVGDLIFVNVSQVGAPTVTAVSDNLGNNLTALTEGVATGQPSGWFCISAYAGDCTPVATCTGSTNDGSIVCCVYKGPFAAIPLDKNPAVAADFASPYAATTTGTLAQAGELIVGYFGHTVGTVYSAPTPTGPPATQLDKKNLSGTAAGSIGAAVTSLVVAITDAVVMGLTGTASTGGGAGVATFRKYRKRFAVCS